MALRLHDGLRRGTRTGQVSTMLILFIAGVLTLAMVTANVGKVGLVRTTVSNAADAAALAAASWVASAENEVSAIAEIKWIAYIAQTVIFAVPFHSTCGDPIVAILFTWASYLIGQKLLTEIAGDVIHLAWDLAGSSALQVALANAGIDDTRPASDPNSFAAKMKQMSDRWKATQDYPTRRDVLGETGDMCMEGDTSGQKANNPYFTFTWDRNPDDPNRGETTVTVEADKPCAPPELIVSSYSPLPLVWLPPFGPFGWAAPGWQGSYGISMALKWIPLPWFQMTPAVCAASIPIPAFLGATALFDDAGGAPDHLEFPNNGFRVIVRRTEQNGELRLWTMQYGNPDATHPTEVAAMAVGSYGPPAGVNMVGFWPSKAADVKLAGVQ